ncbi:hypothetical protein FSP39_007506 [Pinctada imbricata]|uniref:RNA helicase n=1 Tax=Pinctada imbricata TaxID=66713 RepID=A0AA88Y9L5_PINIB|nr:hypothetical protein FSP39_007506 [Pinctada imbricata]
MNEAQKELEFPSSLTATERAYIHRYCDNLNLKHRSRGVGSNRFLTIFKREGNAGANVSSGFQLVRNSRQQITSLLQRFPLSGKERQELLPRSDKSQPYDASKDLTKTTIGRLNNGLAQVPTRRQNTDLDSFRDSLPVSKFKDEIINTINNNRVTLISGETGSGKTTQVPQMILDDCFSKNRPCRIFCTQPRRIAALSVAERVATERGERIGQTVGYQIRLESKVSPKTLLTFCTNGVLLRTLMMSKNAMSTVTHVILDEVHERDRFSDFLITAIRDEMPKYGHFKVILMSAALNVDLFVKYFNHCPVISIPGNLFEVKEYFLEDVLKWLVFEIFCLQCIYYTVAEQQEYLSHWCTKLSISDAQTESHVQEFDSKIQPESMNAELMEEKEELEPWLVKEVEELMSEVWLTGNDHAFSQIFHLMVSENVSVDYQHTETSLSCLMIAAARGFIPVVEQLLNLGANVRLRASNDWTAIDWAKKFNQTDIAELLESYIVEAETSTLDTVDDTSTPILSEEDQELLSLYQHSFDDDKVDLDLVLALLIKILSSKIDGSVLIFLPGYDDIVSLRDKIGGDKFFEKYRYIIFTLHSSMQSSDQRRVFKAAPNGVTKLILSTNIAETSITINDVVCVINSGKVKEKTFDALMSMSQLKSVWISKASSLQRKGRTQLLGQLRASGFVRARGGGDIRDLNTNSENWAVVKAALCAGAYPFILKVDKAKGRIVSQKESNIKFKKPSVFEQPVFGNRAAIKSIPSEWIIYEEMSRANRFAMVTTCTAVTSVSVALFAGPSKLAPDSVRNGETRKDSMKSGMTEEESSDSEEEEKDDFMKTTIQLDDWLAFKFDNETANLILQLRHKWNSLLIRRMKSPSKPWSQVDDAIVKTIVNVLTNEEQAMGFQQPAGIGQRPKPMSADSFVAVGNSGYTDYDDYYEGRGNNRGRRVPATPPRKNYQFQPRTPRTPGSKPGSNNSSPNVNNNSTKGSNSSTPCASPLTGTGDVHGNFSGPSRYYIMKCSNYKQLDGSMNKGTWSVYGAFEKKINKEFEARKNVYLVFSVQGTGQFQGYARMISPSSKNPSPNSQGSATSSTFSIEWIKR